MKNEKESIEIKEQIISSAQIDLPEILKDGKFGKLISNGNIFEII